MNPDTDAEQHDLPEPASLKGNLLLGDRGYLDLTIKPSQDRDCKAII
jgi:hypothetical protein